MLVRTAPADWWPIPRPNAELLKGWLVFDDAVEKASRLIYGSAWTGEEHVARKREEAAPSTINALSDQELARENKEQLRRIAKTDRKKRAEHASCGNSERDGADDTDRKALRRQNCPAQPIGKL